MVREYVCINCGREIKELYKKFSPAVIKLTKCDRCYEVADKYIEYEAVIILIDSILLSKQAYRHILYNGDFKIHWKLSIVLLLLESFALWRQKLNQPLLSHTDDDDFVNEKGFYICCLENIIDHVILFVLMQFFTILFNRKEKVRDLFGWKPALYLYKSITISNFAKFFLLPILIWKDNTTEAGSTFHYLIVMGYYLVSLIQVYSVVVNISTLRSVTIVLLAFSIKQYVANNIMIYVDNNYL